jgi:hypothetical protein
MQDMGHAKYMLVDHLNAQNAPNLSPFQHVHVIVITASMLTGLDKKNTVYNINLYQ